MSDSEYVVDPDTVESQVFDWGVLKWTSTPDVTGGDRFSAGVVKLEPGKGHERHTHPDSDEILYVIRGEGEQEVADETHGIEAGDTVFVPEGVEHGTVNTGWEPLLLLAVYAPPGPEEVLGNLPECEIVPPGEVPTTGRSRSTRGREATSGRGNEPVSGGGGEAETDRGDEPASDHGDETASGRRNETTSGRGEEPGSGGGDE